MRVGFGVSRSKSLDASSDEVCFGLVRGVLERVYTDGVDAAQKYLKEFSERNPLLGYDSVCMGFVQALIQGLVESNMDHAVVEAMMRCDRVWVERCLASVRAAQEALYLPEEEYFRLKVLEQALSYVLTAVDKGLKPKLGG